MDLLLQGLRAAGEATRLRILGLCGHAELTVSELVEILGQSQPRLSRHLRLLVEAGLLERYQEGNWAYYRQNEAPGSGELARALIDLLPADDPLHAEDLARLQRVKEAWAVKVAAYFQKNAPDWSRVSGLHVDDRAVDTALLERLSGTRIGDLLDLGTGTGHTLELLGRKAESGIGIASSHARNAASRRTTSGSRAETPTPSAPLAKRSCCSFGSTPRSKRRGEKARPLWPPRRDGSWSPWRFPRERPV